MNTTKRTAAGSSGSRRRFTQGNAIADGKGGWFVGQFVNEEGGLRRQQDFEMKWGTHPKGERKTGRWAVNKVSTTLSMLLEGEFIIWLRVDGKVREVRLKKRGDYVIWGAGVAHSWEAPEDCIILTVRCPSVAGDQVAGWE